MKYLGTILLFSVLFGVIYFAGSAIISSQATNEYAYQLAQQVETQILQRNVSVIYDTYVTVNPTVTYQYADNTDAFIQQLSPMNITKVYVTGSSEQGYNFHGYTSDWATEIYAYAPRPIIWKWAGT